MDRVLTRTLFFLGLATREKLFLSSVRSMDFASRILISDTRTIPEILSIKNLRPTFVSKKMSIFNS